MVACAVIFVARAPAQSPDNGQPFNNAPGVFRFAILPDRTGGNRPLVFEGAIEKLNRLQPEFVMSTGDLIDGYTTDPKVWTAQWSEFETLVDRLQMRFHYVPGNHDIGNPLLLEAWRERHGVPWSSFVYGNVLFLCLHTEDRPLGGLGAEQIAWAQRTLVEHPDVRWTLLFLHRPLWREKNQLGYEQIRAALRGRNYTVFAGHYHSFLKETVDGMNHYVVATAGGSSALRGAEFGEFDHVLWVTMKPDGPVVANLALDGILGDDLVTAETLPAIAALRDGSWLRPAPVVHPSPEFHRLSVPVELRNPTDWPLHVHGSLPATAGLYFSPDKIDRVVAPRQTDRLAVELVATREGMTVSDADQAGLAVTWSGGYEIDGRRRELPATQPFQLDWKHVALRAAEPLPIDGRIELPERVINVTRPMTIRESWDWHGAADGRFAFAVLHVGQQVFVSIRTEDDRVVADPSPDVLQDKLMVRIRTSSGVATLEGIAGTRRPDVAVTGTPAGLVGEFSFTLPAGDRSFQLNVGWQDHDRPENTKPSVLWWRDPAVAAFGEFDLE